MAFPRTIYIPKQEKLAFEERAKASYPVEREDYLLGEVEKRHLTIRHIVPTLPEHVVEATTSGITLALSAGLRAAALAAERGLIVVGTVHSHTYRRVKPIGITLSSTDFKAFPPGESFVIGVCKVVPAKLEVCSFNCWLSFWQQDSSLSMRVKYY